ncbi:hypothetical protein [Dyella terrae]|uniref:hypothetical protein n=1 Tax=Dyella terrae TaxID=522259 RepID=UPI001EFEBB84|nr:hypothetical protein [Dyella terrae]
MPVLGRTPGDLTVRLNESGGLIQVFSRDATGREVAPAKPESSYDLYARATAQYPGCPSAGYELLRFGRVLGPDALAAGDQYRGRVPHIRQVRQADQDVFLDLNTAGVQVYSDADFPDWAGWTFIADDVNVDSRARSATLLNLIDPPPATPPPPPATPLTPEHVAQQRAARYVRVEAAMANAAVRKRLRRCVVTMATEWSTALFEQHWSWLKGKPSDPRGIGVESCVSDDVYTRFQQHYMALSFWEAAGRALSLSPG